jgi:hypothetical protein
MGNANTEDGISDSIGFGPARLEIDQIRMNFNTAYVCWSIAAEVFSARQERGNMLEAWFWN